MPAPLCPARGLRECAAWRVHVPRSWAARKFGRVSAAAPAGSGSFGPSGRIPRPSSGRRSAARGGTIGGCERCSALAPGAVRCRAGGSHTRRERAPRLGEQCRARPAQSLRGRIAVLRHHRPRWYAHPHECAVSRITGRCFARSRLASPLAHVPCTRGGFARIVTPRRALHCQPDHGRPSLSPAPVGGGFVPTESHRELCPGTGRPLGNRGGVYAFARTVKPVRSTHQLAPHRGAPVPVASRGSQNPRAVSVVREADMGASRLRIFSPAPGLPVGHRASLLSSVPRFRSTIPRLGDLSSRFAGEVFRTSRFTRPVLPCSPTITASRQESKSPKRVNLRSMPESCRICLRPACGLPAACARTRARARIRRGNCRSDARASRQPANPHG